MSEESIISKYKQMAEDPYNSTNIANDPMFSTQNILDPMFYVDQLKIILKDSQELVGTAVVNKLDLPSNYADPIGITIPLALVLFELYALSRTLIRNLKTVGVLSGATILAYIYLTISG